MLDVSYEDIEKDSQELHRTALYEARASSVPLLHMAVAAVM